MCRGSRSQKTNRKGARCAEIQEVTLQHAMFPHYNAIVSEGVNEKGRSSSGKKLGISEEKAKQSTDQSPSSVPRRPGAILGRNWGNACNRSSYTIEFDWKKGLMQRISVKLRAKIESNAKLG